MERFSGLGLILASVTLNAAAQIALRAGARGGFGVSRPAPELIIGVLTRPAIVLGLLFYGVSAVLWIIVLSRTEASFAYPFLGLGFIMVAISGHFLLGETLSAQRLVAIGIIATGIAILARS